MGPAHELLPFFPLNVVVFPGEKLELYIFEPRYCELIHQCEENEHSFGIIPVLKDEVLSYGTEVELLKVNRLKSHGTSRIEVRGKRIFSVGSFQEKLTGHLYGGGEVLFRNEVLQKSTPALTGQVNSMFTKIRELLKQKGGFVFANQHQDEEISHPSHPPHSLGNSYDLAPHLIGLDLKEKIILLSMEHEEERLRFIYEHMKTLITVLENSLNDPS